MKTVVEHLGSVILAMLVGLTLGFKEPVGTFMENIIDQLEAKVDDAFGFGNGSADEGDAGGEQGPTTTVTLEGDGQTYNPDVPEALTFRSPAPLSEFQELTLNGETVDPANYTTEEGSTIVTLSATYLETLDSGSYEIAIVSDSMIGEGTFEVSVASGAYDAEGNLVAKWADLVNTYGMDVSKAYTSSTYATDTASPYYVLTNTAELSEVTNLIIPASVTTIGEGAFYNCTSLTTVTFADGSQLTTIGNNAFYKCTALTNITVDANNTKYSSVDGVLFDKNQATLICYPAGKPDTSYVIPSGVTEIGGSAFHGCSALTSVTFAEGSQLTTIGSGAFYGCTNLTSIEIPANVTTIGTSAFSSCTSLTSITFAEGSQLTSIGQNAFFNCTTLENINIPDGTTTIGVRAFSGCENLTGMIIPDSVTTIGSFAFENCAKLATIVLPSGMKTIESSTFTGCTALTSIEIPAGVTILGGTLYGAAFADCTSLKTVTFANGSRLKTVGVNTFNGCRSLTSIELPATVTSICKSAFANCQALTSIDLPAGVTTIGQSAFSSCTSLASIEIPAGVTTIDQYAFRNCTSLTSVTIPASVTSIGGSAFYDCDSLTSIEIPANVTTIGKYALHGCKKLTSMSFEGTAAQWSAITKGSNWNYNVPATSVSCTDGTVSLK